MYLTVYRQIQMNSSSSGMYRQQNTSNAFDQYSVLHHVPAVLNDQIIFPPKSPFDSTTTHEMSSQTQFKSKKEITIADLTRLSHSLVVGKMNSRIIQKEMKQGVIFRRNQRIKIIVLAEGQRSIVTTQGLGDHDSTHVVPTDALLYCSMAHYYYYCLNTVISVVNKRVYDTSQLGLHL